VIRRGVVTILAAAGALLLLGAILPGFNISGLRSAIGVSLVCGAFNVVVWPVFVRLALPLTVLTLGLPVLLLNGLVVLLAAWVVPGVEVRDVWTGIAVTFGITAVTTFTGALLAIDDEPRVRRHLLRRAPSWQSPAAVPGVLFLEIDGLAHEVLRRAMRDGNAPTLARWLREGSHELRRWETDWSSQTGACQAGLLHGNNTDIPAFRWWEKESGRALVTNHPRDAAEIEHRVSDGRGLLHDDGASRANILSGDAPHSLLTMSTVLEVRRRGQRLGQDYAAYFSSPYNLSRTVLAALLHMAREVRFAADQRRRDVRPRIRRGLGYAPVRAWATAVQRDLQVSAVVADTQDGRPVVYTTFLAYDEVAHHSGLERPDTLDVLRDVDRQIGRIAAAAACASRPYRIVVLSDHGQSQGATFRERYGITLDELVRQACEADAVESADSGEDEALGRLGAALTEAAAGTGLTSKTVRVATRRKRIGKEVRLGEGDDADRADGVERATEELPEVVVLASGCLGLITFPRLPGRVTLEQIEERYPKLLPALRAHPGVGFVHVRSEGEGAVALGAEGAHWLRSGRIEGEDPLTPFGPHAAAHVLRTDAFPHCPDLLVNSTYWADTDEVAAFEELVGSHGGLGGTQSFPFVLAPASWRLPDDEVVGSEHLHRWMRRWLGDLGHDAFRDDGPEV
jgi:uncharacterized membrane protein YvlD (DUF360 family)